MFIMKKIIFIYLFFLLLKCQYVYSKENNKITFYNKNYAICIGINNYKYAPPLNFAVNDAKDIKTALLNQGFDTVILLTDSQATRVKIMEAFEYIRNVVTKEDRIIFYFAGHGDTLQGKDDIKKGYLIPVDCDYKSYLSKGIYMGILKELADLCQSKHILFILDSCYSGYSLKRDLKSNIKKYYKKLANLRSVQVISSARKEETAGEVNGHGIFTKYLLECLNGKYKKEDNILTVTDIFDYCRDKVGKETNGQQMPQYSLLEGEGEMLFVPNYKITIKSDITNIRVKEIKKQIIKITNLENAGLIKQAEEIMSKILQQIEFNNELTYLNKATYYNKYAKLLNKMYKSNLSIYYCEKIYDLCDYFGDTFNIVVANSFQNIGIAYLDIRNYEKAINYFKKALNIYLSKYDTEYSQISYIYDNIGIVYIEKGEYNFAEDFFNKALRTRKKNFQKEPKELAFSYTTIGNLYSIKGEFNKALNFYNKVLEIALNNFEFKHPNTAIAYNNIGLTYRDKGQYDTALNYFYKAIDIQIKKLGKTHPELCVTYSAIGSVYFEKSEYEIAFKYFNKALDKQLKLLNIEHVDIISSYFNLSNYYLRKYEYDKAFEMLNKAFEIEIKISGKNHPIIADIYYNFGGIYLSKAEFDTATNFYNKGLKIYKQIFGVL